MKRAKTGCEIQLSEFGSKHKTFSGANLRQKRDFKALKRIHANREEDEIRSKENLW